MISHVLSVPLASDMPEFSLSAIRNEHRVNEMEFYFPMHEFEPEALYEVFNITYSKFSKIFYKNMHKLGLSKLKGFMKGFIDLVFQYNGRFYIIDWKSNYLGSRIDDYRQSALQIAMVKEYYVLQYMIYTVALIRYLKNRVPDFDYNTHFGGVFYIFLRGVNQHKGSDFGIFHDRPPETLINDLSRVLTE
jgi:exodeoxyribonuclease V beta subunit